MELVARQQAMLKKDDFMREAVKKKATNRSHKSSFQQALKASERSESPQRKAALKTHKSEKTPAKMQTHDQSQEDKIEQLEAAIQSEGNKAEQGSETVETKEKPSAEKVDTKTDAENKAEVIVEAEESVLVEANLLAELTALLEQLSQIVAVEVETKEQNSLQLSQDAAVEPVANAEKLPVEVNQVVAMLEDLVKLEKGKAEASQEQADLALKLSDDGELKQQLPIELVNKLEQLTSELGKFAAEQKPDKEFATDEFAKLLQELKGEITKISEEKPAAEPAQILSTKTFVKPLKAEIGQIAEFGKVEQTPLEIADKTVFAGQKIAVAQAATRQSIMAQVTEAINKTPLSAQQSEMIIKLKPEQLGKLELKIEVHNDNVIAKFEVASQMVKQAIESNLEDLRNSLKDKGFSDMTFDVNVKKDNDGQTGQSQSNYRRRIDFVSDVDESKESYIRSLSALVAETTFEHLA